VHKKTVAVGTASRPRPRSSAPRPGRDLWQSEAVYAKAQEPKELDLIEGGTHFDFYDRPEYVTPAIAKIDSFFKQHL
jgi:fermentation-respiration switch protein FrsA (DUF1100 family)